MLYALLEEGRSALMPRLLRTARALEGVDLVIAGSSSGEAVIARGEAELRFAPGSDVGDARGERWSVEGDVAAARGPRRGRRAADRELPGRARARVVGADLPDGG